jgi:hypothetical protein
LFETENKKQREVFLIRKTKVDLKQNKTKIITNCERKINIENKSNLKDKIKI